MTDRNDVHEPAEDVHDDGTHEAEDGYTESETAPAAPRPATRRAPRRPPRQVVREVREVREKPAKSPMLAAILGIVPGLGNIYNGLYARGFTFFLLVFSLIYVAAESGEGTHLALLIPSIIFTWLFNIFDGYRQATLINWGWEEEDALAAQCGSGSLAAGIALFVIGTYGLLHQFFDIDLSALLDHWYLILLAVGGWLIYQSWGDKKSDATGDSY